MPDNPSTSSSPPDRSDSAPAGSFATRLWSALTGPRVPLGEKVAVGAGFLPIFYGNAAVKSFAVPVYQMTLHLNPVIFGIAMAVPRIWDALTDPLAGLISDNTRSKFGRRRPFIFVGAFLQAITFGAIWMVSPDWSQSVIAAYLIATLLLFYTGFTIFSVPLTTLTYEMTPDYHERTVVAAFCTFFQKLGELSYSWLFPATQLAMFGSVMMGVRSVGWVVAIAFMGVLGVLPALFAKERYYEVAATEREKVPFFSSFRDSFRNRAFFVLVLLTMWQILAGTLASNVDYYLLVYYMSDGDVGQGSILKAWLSTSYAVVGWLSIPLVTWFSRCVGKRQALSWVFVMVLFGAVGKWFLFTPGHEWKIVFDAVICGPIWVALAVLTQSMLADVCDADEWTNGMRREGMFGAIFSWITKTGYSLGFLGTGIVLVLTGFDASLNGAQPEGTIPNLRLFLAGSTALWAIVAILILKYYPLSQERVEGIRLELEERRGKI